MIQKTMEHQLEAESGQAMVEYALIIAILVIAIFVVMSGGFAARVFEIYQFILDEASAVF